MVTYRNLLTILNLDELRRNTGEEIMERFSVFFYCYRILSDLSVNQYI